MSGDRAVLVDDGAGRIRAFVEAMERFPRKPRWVVVGGFAVIARIVDVHPITNDVDTLSADAPALVELLIDAGATPLAAAKLELAGGSPAVQVDVMGDTQTEALPPEAGDRAFALVRRFASQSATVVHVEVVGSGRTASVVATAEPLVATVPALIAMKAVSLPRRANSNHPEKAGSDIHDLGRLVVGRDLNVLADAIVAAGAELAGWVGDTLARLFSPQRDLPYTIARLRRLAGLDAATVSEDDLTLVGELGLAIAIRT